MPDASGQASAAIMAAYCQKCGGQVSGDEIGLYKKLVNRGASTYLCKVCLAERFSCDTELLDEKIRQFKRMGCTLFVREEK